MTQGKTSWEAGRILGVSEHTLSAHVANAAAKMAATNRAHLVARAFVLGVLCVSKCIIVMALCALLTLVQESSRRPPRPARRAREETCQEALA